MVNMISFPQQLIRIKVRLVQEADVNTVFTEELVHFQLLTANPVNFQIGQQYGLSPSVFLGRAVTLSV